MVYSSLGAIRNRGVSTFSTKEKVLKFIYFLRETFVYPYNQQINQECRKVIILSFNKETKIVRKDLVRHLA